MRVHFLPPAALLVACLLAVGGTAQAGQFYKWVDEKGVTHYGEKAPEGTRASTVKVDAAASSDQETELQRLQERRDASATAKDKAAAAEADRKAQALPADEQERARKVCAQHRKNLETLQAGGRIRTTDAQGNPRFLTDEELAEKLKYTQGEVERCAQFEKASAAPAPAAR